MTAPNFENLFIEEVPDHVDVEGSPMDGYTVIRATGPLTVPVLRERVFGRVEFLRDLIDLEEAGGRPAGLVVDEYSPSDPSTGIFGAALLETMGSLIRNGGKAYLDKWGRQSVVGIDYSVDLSTRGSCPETHLTIWADRERARELIRSGALDMEKLDIELTQKDGAFGPEDEIPQMFAQCVGDLILQAAVEPIRRASYSPEYC
ncbi:hypothetical protein [Pseudarthrobacter sp. Y6]|uniref:hypothetical protein n=1 Tax=Pseudarthrobacter sp. Y6 TaxID=3418422 RepID=UPI003CE71FF3